MFSFVRYGPLWPSSLRGRSRAPILDIPPRHFLVDFNGSSRAKRDLRCKRSAWSTRRATGYHMDNPRIRSPTSILSADYRHEVVIKP